MGAATAYKGLFSIIAVCALALVGCGGDSDFTSAYKPPESGRPAQPASAFPQASGSTLREVLQSTDAPLISLGLRIEPTAMVFDKGRNRYPIQITTKEGAPVDDVDLALYLAKVPKPKPRKGRAGKAPTSPAQGLDSVAQGPFPARMETLATDPQFTARSTAEDPHSATAVYVGELNFPAEGEWVVGAVVKKGEETFSTVLPQVTVGEFQRFPKVGQRAPAIPDIASALGKEPILLVFASPKFSSNRTAGPTLDVAKQVAGHFQGQAAFINVEIYNDNDPSKGVRPQVRAYRLPTEPWLFGIDRQGRIVGEVEGAIGVAELTRLVERAIEK
ncbi:MAG TPA: hypothetical protein VFU11_03765 [Solirubrobacterales bacterium]|nr:hypothetical protein [Solirubrobacterales bacterium]